MINQFIHHLYLASLCSSYFACMLMLYWSDLFKYVGVRWSYYLWFILVIPWVVTWLPLNFYPELDISAAIIRFPLLSQPFNALIVSTPIHLSFSLAKLIFSCWLLGASGCSLYFFYKHIRFNHILKNTSSALTISQQELVKKSLANSAAIPLERVYLSTAVATPMISHLIHSKIYLPYKFFDIYTVSEQKYIFQHECVHYQRCDLIANFVMLILRCVNWFNPIIYFSYRYFCIAQELSCDEILGNQYSSKEKKEYGYTLLKSASGQASLAPVINCAWSRSNELKERFLRLKSHRPTPLKNLFGLFLFALAVGVAIVAPYFGKPDTANEFRVANSTRRNITMAINNHCLTEEGIIDSNGIKVFSSEYIARKCNQSRSACEVSIYLEKNCLGKPLGLFSFDFVSGATSIESLSKQFQFSMRGNNLFITEKQVD